MHQISSRFSGSQVGSVAVHFALLVPLLLFLVGGVVDIAGVTAQRQRLQTAVDEATLAAARELGLADAKTDSIAAVIEALVQNSIAVNRRDSYEAPILKVQPSADTLQIDVTATQPASVFFGYSRHFLPAAISVTASARIVGRPNICVLALEANESGAVWLEKQARLTGNRCAVFSNSASGQGVIVRDAAAITAQQTCSAGGFANEGTVTPAPLSDCPQFNDPLSSRPEPTVGACTYSGTKINNETIRLRPGVYCGGIAITGKSDVSLEPGEYIIKDGMLRLDGTAKLVGENVTLYLHTMSFLYFGADTSVELTASKSGPMAGLLIFGSRSQSKLMTHLVLSRNAHKLVGTIYLPQNSFVVDGEASVGGDSAYTAIVARRLVLLSGPNLILNANYDLTDVPVPPSLRGTTHPAHMVK